MGYHLLKCCTYIFGMCLKALIQFLRRDFMKIDIQLLFEII